MNGLHSRRMLAALCVLALVACAGGGASHNPGHVYDLGVDAPATEMPPLVLRDVRALQPFDGVAMYYRLSYRDGAEVIAFTQSRWVAPPGDLVRRQLARAMRHGTPHCALEVELEEFSQVFDASDRSTVRLELVVRLDPPGARSETRVLRITEPEAGANAAQGATAMRRAVSRAVSELARWIDGVAACRG